VHHTPSGPSFAARVTGLLARARFRAAGLIAPLAMVAVTIRRTRVVPVTLLGLVLVAIALTAPIAKYDDGSSSADTLSSTSGTGRELVPATGDGWTRDGLPEETSRSERSPASSSSASSKPDHPSASSAPTSADAAERAATVGSSPSSSSDSSSASASESSAAPASEKSASASSSEPSSSAPARPATPAAPASTPAVERPTAETPSADPVDVALAAVNAERRDADCAALDADAGLASVAAEHSSAMDEDGFVDVRSPDGGAPLDRGDRTAVVASGSDPAAVAAGWLADATDRAALLDCGLTRAGVGIAGHAWTLLAA
jgi:uncharacterized protein YkwD